MEPDREDGQGQAATGGQAILQAQEKAATAAPGRRSEEEATPRGALHLPTAAAGLGGALIASENTILLLLKCRVSLHHAL
jgi:hypothetical protein